MPEQIQTSNSNEQISTASQRVPQHSKNKPSQSPYKTREGKLGPIQAKQRPVNKSNPAPRTIDPFGVKPNPALEEYQSKMTGDYGVGKTDHTPIQRKPNNTGLPDNLKTGIENLSGYAMDDVKVHYNSDKPVQLNAHAYAQGTDIHLAAGQERHLPHEAWHVVQQKQGRVKPTRQMKGGTQVNDDQGLEREADMMGQRVLQTNVIQSQNNHLKSIEVSQSAIQRKDILNLASGTEISKLEQPKNEGDTVLNVDRGDMLAARFVLKDVDTFKSELDKALPEKDAIKKAKSRLPESERSNKEAVKLQMWKEQVDRWFYGKGKNQLGGDIEKIFEKVRSKRPDFESEMNKYEELDNFSFESVGPEMNFAGDNSYDEIRMVSGRNISLFGEENTLKEIHRILRPGGFLIVKGNEAALRTNGLDIESERIKVGDKKYKKNTNVQRLKFEDEKMVTKYFEIIDWGVAEYGQGETSEHTVGGGFAENDLFHEMWFQSLKPYRNKKRNSLKI